MLRIGKADPESSDSLDKEEGELRIVKTKPEPNIEELLDITSQAILLIKEYIQADEEELFLVLSDDVSRIINKDTSPTIGPVSYPIGSGGIIAAYTAECCTTLDIEKSKMMSENHPRGIGQVRTPVHVLSIPFVSGSGDTLAVFEFYRINSPRFTKAQVSMAECMMSWLGRSIKKKPENVIIDNDMYRSWITDMKGYQHGDMSIEQFISRALGELQIKTEAGAINFYRVQKGSAKRMYSVYGQLKPGCFVKSKRKFMLDNNDFLKTVAKRHRAIIVNRSDMSQFLEKTLQNRIDLSPQLSNYLCVPIGAPFSTLAVIELINKKYEEGFNEDDINAALQCGRLCYGAIHLDDISSEFKKMTNMLQMHDEIFIPNLAACPHSIEEFFEKLEQLEVPENFYTTSYYPTIKELYYLEQYCWVMFKEVFRLNDVHDKQSMDFIYLILTAKKGYRKNGYHNFEHGFIVCHTMFVLTRKNKHIFSDLEIKALVVACLCHDLDHPGQTNRYVEHSNNPLSKLYKHSYLENHHSRLTKIIVQTSKIFSDLSKEDYKFAFKLMHKAIMYTDFFSYFYNRIQVLQAMDKNTFCLKNPENKDSIIGLMMTGCDLVCQAKSFSVSSRVIRNLYTEFFVEADNELLLGNEPTIMMNRLYHDKVPEFQLQFIYDLCIPCWQILNSVLLGVTSLYRNCLKLYAVWENIRKEKIYWDVFTEEYIYNL